MSSLGHRLHALGPQSVLDRGFSITLGTDGTVIRSASQVRSGLPIRTQLADGSFHSTVGPAAPHLRPKRIAVSSDPKDQMDLFTPGE